VLIFACVNGPLVDIFVHYSKERKHKKVSYTRSLQFFFATNDQFNYIWRQLVHWRPNFLVLFSLQGFLSSLQYFWLRTHPWTVVQCPLHFCRGRPCNVVNDLDIEVLRRGPSNRFLTPAVMSLCPQNCELSNLKRFWKGLILGLSNRSQSELAFFLSPLNWCGSCTNVPEKKWF
jgi:hypothetical protein